MIGRAAVVVAGAVLLAAGCTTADGPPTAGPGGGPVDVRPSAEPAPGATLTLSLSAEDADTGSACTTLDEWVDGGWQARWYWERTSTTAVAIPDGEERTCPAIAVPLPGDQPVVVPDDLSAGTWRFAYLAGEDDIGAYVFEVG